MVNIPPTVFDGLSHTAHTPLVTIFHTTCFQLVQDFINSSTHFTWQELAPLLVPLHHGAEKIKATFQDFGVCIATGLASFGDNVGDRGRY